MRKPAKYLVAGCLAGLIGIYACSDSGSHPPPSPDVTPDGSTISLFDGSSKDGASESGADGAITDGASDAATYPPTCSNGILDGTETDVDCGGNVCKPCIDGKACIANTDCIGVFCDTVSGHVCTTPTCHDGKLNGSETDVDCGGTTCAKCTFGKKCVASTDCVSATCDSTKTCACPARMAVATTAGSITYCIDATEVTRGDYDRFITANQSITQQIPACATANTTYVPTNNWPPPPPLNVGYPAPVRNVDWCDAYAYCRWAGKQLCGKIGGGSIITDADGGDGGGPYQSSVDAWDNACSAQGQNTWPYSASTFDQVKCNGGPYPDGGVPDAPWSVVNFGADGTYSGITADLEGCYGGETNLFGMSGNVAEWEDACDSTGTNCLARGGSYLSNNNPVALSCAGSQSLPRMSQRPEVGFRCCQF